MTEIPEGTGVEITPGTVAGGVAVNAELEPSPQEYTILRTFPVAGKMYHRVVYPDGSSKLIPA